MITFANCKINLGLYITGKLPDGYHSLETCFYPVPWYDVLEILPRKNGDTTEFKSTGIRVFGPKEKNLCLRAYDLLNQEFKLGPVKIHLHKVIPIGAGLGGGSSDAAHALLLLNKLFKLKLSEQELEERAIKLGSDCPFFIRNKPVLATGKGNIFHPLNLKLKNYFLVIVKPRVHISTAEAYAGVSFHPAPHPIGETLKLSLDQWKERLGNDFEKSVFEKNPGIRNIKNKLYKQGAIYASMSGSGSAVYGIFNESKNLRAYFRSCTVWQGWLN